MTAPPGSEITVDAETAGKAPLNEAVDVQAGNHTVRVRLPDGTSSEQNVVVTAGQLQPVHFGAAATVVQPTNPNPNPTNPENPPANPPTNPVPEHPNPQPNPIAPVPEGPVTHPTGALALMIGGGVLAVGGFILTGVFASSKATANSNYKSVESSIIDAEKNDGSLPQSIRNNPTCSPPPSSTVNNYAQACATLKSNQDTVNQDATAANAFAVVGVIGVLAAAGGAVWYFVGAKHEAPPTARLTPWIAPGLGGMSLSTTF